MTKRERLRIAEAMQEICKQLDVMRGEVKTAGLRFKDLESKIVVLGDRISDVVSEDDE